MSSQAPYRSKEGHLSTRDKNSSNSSRHPLHNLYDNHIHHHDLVQLTPNDPVLQKPSARNTPMLSFQPHHTEISTDRPSVSGRLFLHIPMLAGKRFHFISLALHLRLRESIAWMRQDLASFETEKKNWSQTVWDKKIMLPYQDRQVDEGDEPHIAIVNEPSKSKGRLEIEAQEWRWEWLVPVTENEVRPESFEGSMGNVWYELEAKCLFRWDDVDQDGNVITALSSPLTTGAISDTSAGTIKQAGATLMKGIDGPSKKATSLVQAFGKLRVGSKVKKSQYTGDFKIESRHDEFIKQSLRVKNSSYTQDAFKGKGKAELLSASARGQSTPHLGIQPAAEDISQASAPLPFLIRKILKLYFIKPLPNASSNNALPLPSMALPILPGTRRFKAIIPGACIQVQIQIPSVIPIRGYAQTSQLVPDHKKGSLVLDKHSAHSTDHNHHHHHHRSQQHHHPHRDSQEWEVSQQFQDSFQVALTVRKLTQSDMAKRRVHSIGRMATVSPFAPTNGGETNVHRLSKMLGSGISEASLSGQSGTGSAEGNDMHTIAAATLTTTGPGRPWRKEVRVRKVKCEFWQKESCRIPSSTLSGSSRSIKHALGPAFTYSEKERERSRASMQLLPHSVQMVLHGQTQQLFNSAFIGNATGDKEQKLQRSSSSGPHLSPVLKPSNTLPQKQQHQAPSSPLQVPASPYGAQYEGSEASSSANPALHPTSFDAALADLSPSSRPFLLLIPVSLDSPHLRQTFAWPTVDTPSPLTSRTYSKASAPMPRSQGARAVFPNPQALYQTALMDTTADDAATVDDITGSKTLGLDNESVAAEFSESYPSAMASISDHHTVRGQRGLNAAAVRSRIEVKHYLSFRLSLDMLEFEGETEQDEALELEAMEEQQLEQIKIRQMLSAYGSNVTPLIVGSSSRSPSAVSATSTGTSTTTPPLSNDHLERPKYKGGVAKHGAKSIVIAGQAVNMSSTGTIPTSMQPALTFLNSAAGLLDADADLGSGDNNSGQLHASRNRQHNHHQRPSRSNSTSGSSLLSGPLTIQPLLGAVHDLAQRRGSGASQGTMKSNTSAGSGLSGYGATSGSISSGLDVEAIGAINKKTAGTIHQDNGGNVAQQDPLPATAAPIHSSGMGSHRRQNSSAVTVQKLKDFVIRVPITIVIQVDDPTSVGTAGSTMDSDTTDTATRTERAGTLYGSEGSETVVRTQTGAGKGFATEGSAMYSNEYKSTTTVDSTEDSRSYMSSDHEFTTDAMVGQKWLAKAREGGHLHHGDMDEDEEDTEYVEGQFMADQD
ncbi:hypothetical protein BGZ98_004377 [Dissophora globulifera]|nr:hypothetical protein BGZ98_004377 [Dissophora globulifera]